MLDAFNENMGSSLRQGDVVRMHKELKDVCTSTGVVDWSIVAMAGTHQMVAGLMADMMWGTKDGGDLQDEELSGTAAMVVDMDIVDVNPGKTTVETEAVSNTNGSLGVGTSVDNHGGPEMTPGTPAPGDQGNTPSDVQKLDSSELVSGDSDEDDDDDVEMGEKKFGLKEGSIESLDVDTGSYTYKLKNGQQLYLTPDNVSGPAIKKYEEMLAQQQLGTRWEEVLQGDGDEVEFIKKTSGQDALHILKVQLEKKTLARVSIDKAFTQCFFANVEGEGIPPTIGDKIQLTHTYILRNMDRFLDETKKCFFRLDTAPLCEHFQIGVGPVPGGTVGFGVHAKKAFSMPVDYKSSESKLLHKAFAEEMAIVGYALDEQKMKKTGLTDGDVVAMSSVSGHGGLRSVIKDNAYPGVIFVSHGGSLGTLANAGGKYSKMDFFLDMEDDEDDNSVLCRPSPKTRTLMWDRYLLGFFRSNPSIARCLSTDMLVATAKKDGPARNSIIVAGEKYCGSIVPNFYICPAHGEVFHEGEEVFCDYPMVDNVIVSLDETDGRFLGSIQCGYVPPGKRLAELKAAQSIFGSSSTTLLETMSVASSTTQQPLFSGRENLLTPPLPLGPPPGKAHSLKANKLARAAGTRKPKEGSAQVKLPVSASGTGARSADEGKKRAIRENAGKVPQKRKKRDSSAVGTVDKAPIQSGNESSKKKKKKNNPPKKNGGAAIGVNSAL